MRGHWRLGLVVGIMAATLGCATIQQPPSESTLSILRSYRSQLDDRVSSGHLTLVQARDLYYAKLAEIQPPLPDLKELLEFRQQVTAQIDSKSLTPEQADAKLMARESDMLMRWEEMAARYAREQREFERLKQERERGFREEQQPMHRLPTLPPP